MRGNPLAGGAPESVSCFFVSDGLLVFLKSSDDRDPVVHQFIGELGANEAGREAHAEHQAASLAGPR